jgi:hypothetical protein
MLRLEEVELLLCLLLLDSEGNLIIEEVLEYLRLQVEVLLFLLLSELFLLIDLSALEEVEQRILLDLNDALLSQLNRVFVVVLGVLLGAAVEGLHLHTHWDQFYPLHRHGPRTSPRKEHTIIDQRL